MGILTCLLAGGSAVDAADVQVLKSTAVPEWSVSRQALERAAGPDYTFTDHDLRGSRSEAEKVLAGLKGRDVVLVTMGPLATQVAHAQAPGIPLIYCMTHGAEGLFAQPANTAGVSFEVPYRLQLGAFRAVNPRAARIGVIYTATDFGRSFEEAEKAAAALGLTLVGRSVRDVREVPPAARKLFEGPEAVDAFWLVPDPLVLERHTRRYLMETALKARRPVYSFSSALLKEGALVSAGPDFASIGARVAELLRHVRRGGRLEGQKLFPRGALGVNETLADVLGLSISAETRAEAQRILEGGGPEDQGAREDSLLPRRSGRDDGRHAAPWAAPPYQQGRVFRRPVVGRRVRRWTVRKAV